MHDTGKGSKVDIKLHKSELLFLAKFFSIFITLEALINYFGFPALEEFIASTQAALLGLQSSGNLVFVTQGTFVITPSCTGLVSSSVLAAIVYSLKKPNLKKKTLIFLVGASLLVFLNYFRVLLVLWTGKEFGMNKAEITHVASWFSTTLFVLGLWYYFTKKITGAKNFADFI